MDDRPLTGTVACRNQNVPPVFMSAGQWRFAKDWIKII